MEARPRLIRDYVSENGKDPFDAWISGLRDERGIGVIRVRLNRVQQGNFGDRHPVGQGVHELVIDFGPGYRVYFGEDGDTVVLLGGGDKRTQNADIAKAKERWREYNA